MSPTIVLRDGKPLLALGSPGGATIITTVLQILLNRIDFGMTLPEAIAAPRASQRNAPTTQAEPAFIASPYGAGAASRAGSVLRRRRPPGDRRGDRHRVPGTAAVQAAAEPVAAAAAARWWCARAERAAEPSGGGRTVPPCST